MAFQSFGSYGRFQQTPFPDRARKILEEQRARSANEQNYLQQLNQQNQSYLQVMQEKLAAERENRRRNFDYENSLKQQQQDAVERNNKQQIANTTNQAANQAAMYTALADISSAAAEKAGEYFAEQKKKKDEEEAAIEKKKWDEQDEFSKFYSLSLLEKAENEQILSAANSESVVNGVSESGNSAKALDLSKGLLGGYNSVLARQTIASTTANRIQELFENFKSNGSLIPITDPVTGERVLMTLAEAERRGGEYASQATQLIISASGNKLFGSEVNPAFAEKYFYSVARKQQTNYLNRVSLQRNALASAELKNQQENKLNSQIITGLNTDNPFALSTIISSEAVASGKQPGIYRDSVVLPRIQSMLELGAFDSNIDEVEQQILGQTLVLDDGNEVTVAQLAENGNAQALALRESFEERSRNQESVRQQTNRSRMTEEVNLLVDAALSNDGRFDQREFTDIRSKIAESYRDDPLIYRAAVELVGAYDPGAVDKINKETAYLDLKTKAEEGELSNLELQQNEAWLNDAQKKELASFMIVSGAKPGEGYSRSDFESQARKLFKKALESESTTTIDHHSIDWAVTTAGSLYMQTFQDYVNDPKLTIEQAQKRARTDALNDIMGYLKPGNTFYVVPSNEAEGTQAYFENFSVGGSTFQRDNVNNQLKAIANNPQVLETNLYLGATYIKDVKDDVLNGRRVTYSPWVLNVAKQQNLKPYQVLNAQLKAAKMDAEIQPGSYDLLSERSVPNPRLQSLLKAPTRYRVNAAIVGSGNSPATVYSRGDAIGVARAAQFKSPALLGLLYDEGAIEFNKSSYPAPLKRWQSLIEKSSAKYGIPSNLLAAKIFIESKGNPNATSSTGAMGLGQIMQDSHPNYRGGYDPAANVDYSAKYFSELIQQFGDPVIAAGAYNAGAGRMNQHINSGRPLPQETENHMKKFKDALQLIGGSPLQQVATMMSSLSKNPSYANAQTHAEVLNSMVESGLVSADKVAAIQAKMGVDFNRPIIPHTGNQSSDPNFMSPAVAQARSMAVQPNSYVSVTRQDDPNTRQDESTQAFDSAYLDQYVRAVDNTPLSELSSGPIRNRNSWWYPSATRTELKLSKGARFVGEFDGKLILELPDGSRFAINRTQ